MRVILDTNVLLSALLRVDSNPYKCLQAWLDGRFDLVSSAAQLDEITRVARYPRVRQFLEAAEVGWLINRLRERAVILDRLPDVGLSADPGDNFLLAMATAGEVDYLVSGDKAGILALRKHGRTRLITVSRLVAMLKLK